MVHQKPHQNIARRWRSLTLCKLKTTWHPLLPQSTEAGTVIPALLLALGAKWKPSLATWLPHPRNTHTKVTKIVKMAGKHFLQHHTPKKKHAPLLSYNICSHDVCGTPRNAAKSHSFDMSFCTFEQFLIQLWIAPKKMYPWCSESLSHRHCMAWSAQGLFLLLQCLTAAAWKSVANWLYITSFLSWRRL